MINMFNNDSSDEEAFLSFSSSDACSDDESFCSLPSLSDYLVTTLSDAPKNLNVLHINAQSIPAHYSDMLASLDNKNIHAVLVSESWLKPTLPSTSYSLPGFILIRNDRNCGSGGGVAIYLRSNIPYTIVSKSPQPPPAMGGEHLFIEVILSHSKILLGVYYNPSLRINYFTSFEMLLENFVPLYDHSIIMGDFNTCLLKKDSRSSILESIVKSSNMQILPLNATHNFPHSTPSLLDLIMVSSLQHVAKHGQYAADAFSYHDLIFLSYKVRPPKSKPRVIMQRNFGGINYGNLLADAKKWTGPVLAGGRLWMIKLLFSTLW